MIATVSAEQPAADASQQLTQLALLVLLVYVARRRRWPTRIPL